MPCKPQIACPPPTEKASGFQLHSKSGPRTCAPVTGGGMPVEGRKPGVPLKRLAGKSASGSDLFGTSHGYSVHRISTALN